MIFTQIKIANNTNVKKIPMKVTINFLVIIATILVLFASFFLGFFALASSSCITDSKSQLCQMVQGCITNPFIIEAQAEYTFIDGQQCSQFKNYLPNLQAAAARYSTPKLQLNEYIIGGLISRESFWGSLTQGCDGYGDAGNGHGIAQIDGRYSNPKLTAFGSKSTKVKFSTLKYGQEEFSWDSCGDSINYVGAYLMNAQDQLDTKIINQLNSANLSIELDPSGSFKNPKSANAYLRQIINSYNSGPALSSPLGKCTITNDGSVNDNCTTGQDYSLSVLNRALDFMTCIDNIRDKKIEDLLKPTDNKNKKLQECVKKNNNIGSLSKGANNISLIAGSSSLADITQLIGQNKLPFNVDFTAILNDFYTITNGKSIPVPPPESGNTILDGECVSLVKYWQVYIGGLSGYWSNNYPVETFNGLYLKGNKEMAKDNDKYITYGFGSIDSLRAGDIVILDPSSSPSSHTGIATGYVDNNQFEIVDQNWDGLRGKTRKSKYNKNTFVGAIRYIKK